MIHPQIDPAMTLLLMRAGEFTADHAHLYWRLRPDSLTNLPQGCEISIFISRKNIVNLVAYGAGGWIVATYRLGLSSTNLTYDLFCQWMERVDWERPATNLADIGDSL